MGSRLVADGTELPSQMTVVYLPSAIVENMAEFRPEMCTEAAQQGLLQWLLKRLKVSLPLEMQFKPLFLWTWLMLSLGIDFYTHTV